MTKTARTPGPWIFQYSPWRAQDGSDIPAFEVHGEEKVCDTDENRPVEEQEANARLIAAAPEMYDALEHFFNIMHDYESSLQKGYVKHAMDMARAALECAKGGAI
jgi:hypothetical protein